MNQSSCPTFQATCVPFSLSQRERAGVRENNSYPHQFMESFDNSRINSKPFPPPIHVGPHKVVVRLAQINNAFNQADDVHNGAQNPAGQH